jgi:aspartate aminotransferase-like enzyme
MASTIGGVACTFLRGSLATMPQRVVTWSVPGINGEGIALLGRSGIEVRLTAVLYGTALAVETWAAALRAVQGTICAVSTDLGETSAGVLLLAVSPPQKTPARIPGTTTTLRGQCELRCMIVA